MTSKPQKKVSAACESCKARKRKCSATLPCKNCVDNGHECAYGGGLDGRCRESIQRARRESSFHKTLLLKILPNIRRGTDKKLRSLITSGKSLEKIANHLGVPIAYTPDSSAGNETKKWAGSQEQDAQDAILEVFWTATEMFPTPGYVEVFGNLPFSSAISSAGYNPQIQEHQLSNFRIPEYMVQPVNWPRTGVAASGSLTSLLQEFRDSCRWELQDSKPLEAVVGHSTVDLGRALQDQQPRSPHIEMAWTPSTWSCEIQRSFDGLDKYVRLAWIYFLTLYMRWHIAPTPRHYAELPECMRPTLLQRLVPHHAAADLIHHPAWRDMIVLRQGCNRAVEERPDLIPIQVAGLRPLCRLDPCMVIASDSTTLTLSPAFVEAIVRVEEWQAGRSLLRSFPQLEGKLHFVEDDNLVIDSRQLHQVHWT